MNQSQRMALVLSLLAGAFPILMGSTAGAADLAKLERKIDQIDQDAKNLPLRFPSESPTVQVAGDHRLVEGQVLYNIGDYANAAILLLDYVDNNKGKTGYPEGVFFLGDSLYRSGDINSARRYFEEIVTSVKGPYYQDALQRLIEIDLETGNLSGINPYVRALDDVPAGAQKASVPYVLGKYAYFTGKTDEAIRAFQQIPATHRYYMHAQYFMGAARVRKQEYKPAAQIYRALAKRRPTEPAEKRIRELTLLALGRLFYQQKDIDQAIDHYQQVSRHSDLFDTALYEIAWAYVKAEKFENALRALDILALAQPNSPLLPEVRVLQANLLIRLEQWGRATELFGSTRDQFGPMQQRIEELLARQRNPTVFFDLLLQRNLSELAFSVEVPTVAVHWVKARPDVKRAIGVVNDIRDVEAGLGESERLLSRLDTALNSPAKVKVYPTFAAAKQRALQVENRLTLAMREVVEASRERALPSAAPEEKATLDELAARRRKLEPIILNLPTMADAYKSRRIKKLRDVRSLRRRVSGLKVLITNLRAQLVAAANFFEETEYAKDPKAKASFEKERREVESLIEGLSTEAEELVAAIQAAEDASGVAGPEELLEGNIRAEYQQLLVQEQEALASIGNRANGSARADMERLAFLFGRCRGVGETLVAFNTNLDETLDARLSDIRTALASEARMLRQHVDSLRAIETRADDVAGGVTVDGFREVSKTFYEIVVRADVGIIDVAWALKDAKTKQVSSLVRQRKMDLKLLDDEFAAVLQEND